MITKLLNLSALGALFIGSQFTVPMFHPNSAVTSPCSSLPFSDNFVRANGPITTPYSQTSGGTFVISSNTLTSSAFTTQEAWLSGCSGFTSSQYIQTDITAPDPNDHGGFVLYMSNSSNYYEVDCSLGGGCLVQTVIAGTTTYVGAFSGGFTSPATLCAELDSGTSIKLKANGSYLSGSLSVIGLSSGQPGLFNNNISNPWVITSLQAGNGVCP